jgi:hypothetical protein
MRFRLSSSFGDISSWWRVTAPKTICCNWLCPTRWSETCRSTCPSCPIYFRRYLNSRYGYIHSRQSRGDNRRNDHTRKCIVCDNTKILTFMSEALASIEMPQYVRGTRRPHGLATATTNSLPPTPVPRGERVATHQSCRRFNTALQRITLTDGHDKRFWTTLCASHQPGRGTCFHSLLLVESKRSHWYG